MERKKIRVFTSGSFDLFHIGHLNILERSAALGDELIVGVSTDELIQHYKGMPPIIPFEQRFRIISSLKCVTKAVKQVKLTEVAQLQREHPGTKERLFHAITEGKIEDWALPGV